VSVQSLVRGWGDPGRCVVVAANEDHAIFKRVKSEDGMNCQTRVGVIIRDIHHYSFGWATREKSLRYCKVGGPKRW
jgi:hypothetical protein